MSDWERVCWHPDGRVETVHSEYEMLCREVEILGLGIELRLDGELHDIRLSNGMSADLLDITCLEAAAAVLRERLAREIAQ